MSKERSDKKWHWKMRWCRKEGVSPANSFWWGEAENEYQSYAKYLETPSGESK